MKQCLILTLFNGPIRSVARFYASEFEGKVFVYKHSGFYGQYSPITSVAFRYSWNIFFIKKQYKFHDVRILKLFSVCIRIIKIQFQTLVRSNSIMAKMNRIDTFSLKIITWSISKQSQTIVSFSQLNTEWDELNTV